MKNKLVISGIVLIGIIIVLIGINQNKETFQGGDIVKIGVVTPLTGDVSYWGTSSQKGALLAKEDLKKEGIEVELTFEDGGFDPKSAVNSAQKLVNVNGVNAVYSEFNPAAVSINSFLKDKKDVLHVFMAAITSTLSDKEDSFKSYLEFEGTCEETAKVIKQRGVNNPSVLKINLEFGELCLKGIKKVFPEILVESYNAGDRDFKTSLTKLKSKNIDAVFNISFQPETLTALRNMQDLNMDVQYVALTEIISPDVVSEYSSLFEGAVFFGFQDVDNDFEERVINEYGEIGYIHAVGMAYDNVMQIGRSMYQCQNDVQCASELLKEIKVSEVTSFQGYEDRIAIYDIVIEEWRNGELMKIK